MSLYTLNVESPYSPPPHFGGILGGRAKFLKTSKVNPEGPMLMYESIKFNFYSFKRKVEGFYWGYYFTDSLSTM